MLVTFVIYRTVHRVESASAFATLIAPRLLGKDFRPGVPWIEVQNEDFVTV